MVSRDGLSRKSVLAINASTAFNYIFVMDYILEIYFSSFFSAMNFLPYSARMASVEVSLS